MRPGAQRVESVGSVWFFDDDAGEYLRMPKTEGPRGKGPNGEDWGGREAGALEDLRWHPMHGWEVVPRLYGRRQLVIHLEADPDGHVIVAPLPTAVVS